MSGIANDILLRTLRMEHTDRRPVWLMRQAGRYMEEYRRVRQNAGTFMDLCRNPELACEVTLQPVDRFGLDAAIIFSDILTIPAAMGLDLNFVEGEGPVFDSPLDSESRMLSLAEVCMDDLSYVFNAVGEASRALGGKVPLIGFAGAPFTLTCYMIEGRGGEFLKARLALNAIPDAVHHVLSVNAKSVARCLSCQVAAGADAVMLFESWGDLLSDAGFAEFSAPYLKSIVCAFKSTHPSVPLMVFVRAGGRWCEEIADTGCDGIGVDWRANLEDIRKRTGGRVAVQGNLDPAVLLADDPGEVRKCVAGCLEEYGPHPGHVFNLGHGINQNTPVRNVETLVEAVREHSSKMLKRGG